MPNITTIKKRNGAIVPFDAEKIEKAISKSFLAVTGSAREEITHELTESILKKINFILDNRLNGETLSVEEVQDLVEQAIMEAGYFHVAKSYILYRYEHQKIREEKKQEVIKKIEDNEFTILKSNGKRERFSIEKLKKSFLFAIKGFESVVDVEAVINQVKLEIHDGITSSEIDKLLVMVARSLIEQDPGYSVVAARLLLRINYKEVLGEKKRFTKWDDLDKPYRDSFSASIKRGVGLGIYDPRLLSFDLEEIEKALRPERDELLMYLGVQVLYDRYFSRDAEANLTIEMPQHFWMRVAMGLSLLEKKREQVAISFYEMLSTLRFVSSTPTLFHAGTTKPQLSSCYLNTVGDDLDEIFKSYADNAQLAKYSAGLGTDWTSVRATGALIKKTGVHSQGVIPFLKIANDTTVAINRSGRRRGAACVYLECWHYDFEEFIELRKNTGDERRRTHDMNTASWIPDLFMKRIREDADWTLFSPDETIDLHEVYGRVFEERYRYYEERAKEGKIKLFKVMKARDLWKKMINMLFETGHPWVTFKDPSNIRSPQDHVGVVHNSNLCTEITLNNSAEETSVCNLGSINLAKHMKAGVLDTTLLAETAKIAMRMLDNVIDVNFYPTKEAKVSNLRHRPVGLGVMGLQDALYLAKIRFDSDEAVSFSDTMMEFVSYQAILASSELSAERGPYVTFRGSKWDRGILPHDTLDLLEAERGEAVEVTRGGKLDWTPVRESIKKHGMRNSNCLAMAPTATIANISGCIPTIEPIYKNIYVKSNMSGDFTVINPYLVAELKARNLWSYEMLGKIKYSDGRISAIPEIPQEVKDIYKEVFEIHPYWLILAAAHRGKWIDQSQSLNIYFVGTSGRDLASVYEYAWRMGLKTTYYLRSLAASQVEKSTMNIADFGETHKRKSDDMSFVKGMAKDGAVISPLSPVGVFVDNKILADLNPLAREEAIPKKSRAGEKFSEIPDKSISSGNLKLTVYPESACESCE